MRTLLFCVLFLLTRTAGAQQFAVSFPAGTPIYAGGTVPFLVVVAGHSCNSLIVKSTNGKISRESPCSYLYQPAGPGAASFEIWVEVGKKRKKIGTQTINVRERPKPRASISGQPGGTIRKGAMVVQNGLSAEFFVGGNHWEYCSVADYQVILLRNNAVHFACYNKGNVFLPEVKGALKGLLKGDRVLFAGIQAICSENGSKENLAPLEFIIEE